MISFLNSLIGLNRSIFRSIDIVQRWYVLGLILMPIDSFPVFPSSNVYRPISFFPILIYWSLIHVRKLTIHRKDRDLFIILLVAILYTFCWSYFVHENFSGFYKFFINSVVGFIFISSTRRFVLYLKEKGIAITEYLAKSLMLASILPIFIGLIQFASRLNIFPDNLAIFITSIFSYRVDIARIQWLSGEPAMGFRFASMSLMFILLYYNENKSVKLIFCSIIILLLVFSGSTFGYIFVLFIILFNTIFFKKVGIKYLFKALLVAILFALLLLIIFKNLPEYTTKRILNIYGLVCNLSFSNIISLASVDGSFFLRIFNPVIGIIISVKNYGLGIGGECYHFQYIEVIKEYFPFALEFSSVQDVLNGSSIITPKSFYSKLISEFGILGIVPFIVMLLKMFVAIKRQNDNKLKWLFSFLCMMILNVDSYIYFNFLFLLVVLNIILLKKSRSYKGYEF